jgi:hypothetical protein
MECQGLPTPQPTPYKLCPATAACLPEPTVACSPEPEPEPEPEPTGSAGPACTSNAELDAALETVNGECCDEPTEDCSGGYPATCNTGCAAVLRPLQAACAAFLMAGGKALAPVMHLIDAAVATCPAQCEPRPVDTRSADCIAADRELDEEALCRGWNLHWDANAKTCTGGGGH